MRAERITGKVGIVEQLLGGRYRMVEPLGGGGMSTVWRAYDEVLGRQVAVKVVAGQNGMVTTAREWITREARTAAQLSHPHITAVHDYGESVGESGEPLPYVVMELVPGPTLAERLRSGPVPARQALRIGAQVAAALAAAHARGLVHRDIKPANVLLSPSGAKVVDFGIAAVAGEPTEVAQGFLWGTPAYLAPERLQGGEVVPASDVYAFGLLLYRLLADGMPWQTETVTQMLKAHRYQEPAPLPPLAGVPDEVGAIVQECLAKEPADRPAAARVAEVLGAACGWSVAFEAVAHALPTADAPPAADGPPAAEVDPDAETRVVPLRAPGAALAARACAAVPPKRSHQRAVLALASALLLVAAALLAGAWTLNGRHGGQAAAPAAAGGSGGISVGGGSGGINSGGGATTTGAGPAAPGGPAAAAAALAAGGAPVGDTAGGSTGGGPPAPSAGPPPPAPKPDPAPSQVSRTVNTVGGTVTALCVGDTATITGYNPAPGFSVARLDRGPDRAVGLSLHTLATSVKVGFTCHNGTPVASIS